MFQLHFAGAALSTILRSVPDPKIFAECNLQPKEEQNTVQACVCQEIFHFWLKFNFCPVGLVALTIHDKYQSDWKEASLNKLSSYGFHEDIVTMKYNQARGILNKLWSQNYK